MSPSESRRFRFGVFEFDPARAELRRQGLRVKLRGRPLEILGVLVSRAGELVGRDELRDRLWPADTFVDFDHGLNSAVNRLREALGDAADNPRFIETVPRRGYRFIAPLERTADIPAAGTAAGPAPTPRPATVRRPAWLLAGAAALVLAGLVGVLASRWERAPAEAGPLRVAVLPFQDLSSEAGQEYLADGMTDVLITELSQVSALRVISRTTVMTYKGVPKRLSEIAAELQLDAVVEGSVLRSGERARINAQLIDVAADRNLWARSYDCDVAELLDVQRRMAREVTESVRVVVSEAEHRLLGRSSPITPAALEAYIRGRLLRERLTDESLAASRESLELAVELAPDFAAAWAALADNYRVTGAAGYDSEDPRAVSPRARAAAERALELDPEEPLAHAALGMLAFDYDWDFPTAERHLTRALAVRPSFALAHLWYSGYLTAMGRFDEAIEEARRARELDPLSTRANQTLAFRYYYAGRLVEAEKGFREVLEREPASFAARLGLGVTLLRKSDLDGAIRALERAARDSDGNAWALGALGNAYGVAGRETEARTALARLEAAGVGRHVSPYAFALVHVGLGEHAAALEALERAYGERSGWVPFFGVEPALGPLRGEPRFEALRVRIGAASKLVRR